MAWNKNKLFSFVHIMSCEPPAQRIGLAWTSFIQNRVSGPLKLRVVISSPLFFKVFKRVSWWSFRVSTPFSLLCLILMTHFHKNVSFRPDMLKSVFFKENVRYPVWTCRNPESFRLNFIDISLDHFLWFQGRDFQG